MGRRAPARMGNGRCDLSGMGFSEGHASKVAKAQIERRSRVAVINALRTTRSNYLISWSAPVMAEEGPSMLPAQQA